MKAKTITLREDQVDFLEDHDINLSGVVRRRVDEIMEDRVIELE